MHLPKHVVRLVVRPSHFMVLMDFEISGCVVHDGSEVGNAVRDCVWRGITHRATEITQLNLAPHLFVFGEADTEFSAALRFSNSAAPYLGILITQLNWLICEMCI